MRCRPGNNCVKLWHLAVPYGRENVDSTEFCFTAGPARAAGKNVGLKHLVKVQ